MKGLVQPPTITMGTSQFDQQKPWGVAIPVRLGDCSLPIEWKLFVPPHDAELSEREARAVVKKLDATKHEPGTRFRSSEEAVAHLRSRIKKRP